MVILEMERETKRSSGRLLRKDGVYLWDKSMPF